jgi:lysozyme
MAIIALFDQAVTQLRRDEGRRPRAYQDTRGVWTVGYGHNLSTGLLTEAAMLQILRDDLQAVQAPCRALPVWAHLSPPRQGVLLNMAFNLGMAGLRRFERMLAALDVRDYPAAAREMLDSDWARQVGTRADRLSRQMTDDQWV